MSRLRRAGVLGLLVVAVLTAASGIAGAGAKKHKKKTPSWKSSVTLTSASTIPQFSGTVSSKFKDCRADRVVNLFYTDPQGDVATVPLAVDRTNKKGYYAVYLPAAPYAGSYYTTVDAQKIRAQGGPQQCKGATSGAIRVG